MNIQRKPISKQVKEKVESAKKEKPKPEYDGNIGIVISTGSTLLDLAISGGRIRGGGIPVGILVEIFGPSGTGKTALLSEIAGRVRDQGGDVRYFDPEARLDRQFAQLFRLFLDEENYFRPNTVTELFQMIRKWEPKDGTAINGIFADSLAALSTDMEMGDEGDKMGMRRAKEFSEELRKTCRILAINNYLMVCSNQIRDSLEVVGPKYASPGGKAISFYTSLRLRTSFAKSSKIFEEKKIAGRSVKRVIGMNIEVEVFKSSVWKPYRTAPVTIQFDYGIDNIRQNLQFFKTYTKSNVYYVNDTKLDVSMNESIKMVEDKELEDELTEAVIDLWEEIESGFKSNRKTKKR